MSAVALAIGLAGCGSDTEKAPATSSGETTTTTTTETQAPPPEKTLPQYIEENNITETPIRRGDPPPPTIELPTPPGWLDVGDRAPEGSYAAMQWGDVSAIGDPPTIIVVVAKLSGNVDAAKVLEYAPGEIQTLPGYEGPTAGGPTKLGGFDAVQIGGAYMRNDGKRAVGQLTAVVPAPDGLYVIQMNADSLGKQEQVEAMTLATAFMAQGAKITP